MAKLLETENAEIKQEREKNISSHEMKALRRLRKYGDIIIKKSDKGSSTVIMSKEDYINSCLEQLNKPHTRKKLKYLRGIKLGKP
jgi:uncharacterized protein YlbG (UPF0298 family)